MMRREKPRETNLIGPTGGGVQLEENPPATKEEQVRVFGDDGGALSVSLQPSHLRVSLVGGHHEGDPLPSQGPDQFRGHQRSDITGLLNVNVGLLRVSLP
jgi:hypothetical protein